MQNVERIRVQSLLTGCDAQLVRLLEKSSTAEPIAGLAGVQPTVSTSEINNSQDTPLGIYDIYTNAWYTLLQDLEAIVQPGLQKLTIPQPHNVSNWTAIYCTGEGDISSRRKVVRSATFIPDDGLSCGREKPNHTHLSKDQRDMLLLLNWGWL